MSKNDKLPKDWLEKKKQELQDGDGFKRAYLGEFPPDPIYKVLETLAVELNRKKDSRSATLLRAAMVSLTFPNAKPERVLVQVLTALCEQVDDLTERLIKVSKYSVTPIILFKDDDGK